MRVLTQADPEETRRLLDAGEFVWIDLQAPDAAELERLGGVLGLHPLAVEDTRDFGQRAKVDRYGDAALLVYFAAATRDDRTAAPVEVHLHAAEHFLLTVRPDGAITGMDGLHEYVAAHPSRPEDAIVYRVLDALADTLGPALERQRAVLDELDEEILERPRAAQLERLVALKRSSATLKRRLTEQHDLFGALEEAILALPGLGPEALPYLRDVGDHAAHAAADATEQAAALESMTGTYFSANANRLTAVSERLGIAATIILPLTFVTSFFGQNFGWLVGQIDTLETFLIWGVGGLFVPLAASVAYLLARQANSRKERQTPASDVELRA